MKNELTREGERVRGQSSGKTTSLSFNMVDREVNIPEKRHPCRLIWLTERSTFRKNDILVV